MPRYTVFYHLLNIKEVVPQDFVEAATIQEAAEIVARKLDGGGGLVAPFGEDMYAVPKNNVAYCHIRYVVERRRSAVAYNFEEEGEEPAAEAA